MMTETFDPYQKWLGIPADQQPPNAYRLLGIELFESDPDVIEHAADRQMTYLRTFQAGRHSAECQRLLNEVASARFSLLDAQQKSAIDRRIRAQQAALPPRTLPAAGERPRHDRPEPDASVPGAPADPATLPTARRRKSRSANLRTARPLEPASPAATAPATDPRQAMPPTGSSGPARPIPLALPASDEPAGSRPVPASDRGRRGRRSNTIAEVVKVFVGGLAGIGLGLLLLWMALGRGEHDTATGHRGSTPGQGTAGQESPQPRPAGGSVAQEPAGADPFEPLVGEPGSAMRPSPGAAAPDWLMPAEPAVYGVRDVPRYSLDELQQAVRAADQAAPIARQLDADGGRTIDEQRRLARQLHEPFCRLADVVTFADFGLAQVQTDLNSVDELLRQIGDSPRKQQALGFAAAERWHDATLTDRGILLVGKVEQISAERHLYRTDLQLLSGDETRVAVYSWKDPALFCRVSDTALVLGHMVAQPAENLAGYEGLDPRVVWGGYLVTVPSPRP